MLLPAIPNQLRTTLASRLCQSIPRGTETDRRVEIWEYAAGDGEAGVPAARHLGVSVGVGVGVCVVDLCGLEDWLQLSLARADVGPTSQRDRLSSVGRRGRTRRRFASRPVLRPTRGRRGSFWWV